MKRILILFNLIAALAGHSVAQETTLEGVKASEDTLAAYPGGEQAFDQYILTGLRTTKAALAANISGNVVTKFVIDENGRVADILVTKKLGYGCDEQAIALLRHMPLWQPGVINGKRVKTRLEKVFHFYTDNMQAADNTAEFSRDKLPAGPSRFGTQAQDLEKYLQANFVYPAGVKENVEDALVIRFRITPNGITDNIQLVTGLGDAFDQEAIRVIKNMPAWEPKQADFKPVEDYRQLVIGFKDKKPVIR
ncbi:TonB protein C-terminal [Chitinophaga rupis]|uniref:TonB protein C-terminal n=1 Tax=Chitinophaga rupis TaxID=573321 RepID=A0A1H7Q3J2_9BACT|nr:energy transducer TonB [Chitinophaga rupis]SEL42416.1 TonB protein C-terminal [Chitinophaga rupis]